MADRRSVAGEALVGLQSLIGELLCGNRLSHHLCGGIQEDAIAGSVKASDESSRLDEQQPRVNRFDFGGNRTRVIISVRPDCKAGKAIAPSDRIRMASVSDGTSNTFLFGEKFVPLRRLAQFPEDSPAYDGDHLPASCRLAVPGLRLANGANDVLADIFPFGSWHPSGVHFALVDGSARMFSPETDTKVLGSLANRRDARVVELAN